jgi:hypothetical protein
VAYRYLQGIDYGPRDGTLGLSFHMSEGFDGLPEYLARHSGETNQEWRDRVRGVSCNAAILSTGEVVQMLDWSHCSGNLNPADRAGEYGFYGHSKLMDVLGDHWPDPNMWTISAELAGFRANGPTDAQIKSSIAWGLEMRDRFPSIRGSVGHHDQSTKACPGTTPNMLAIFEGIGGHGLFPAGGDVKFIQASDLGQTKLLRLPLDTPLYGFDGSEVLRTTTARDWDYVGLVDAHSGEKVVALNTNKVYADGVIRPTLLVAKTGTLVDAPAPVVVAAAPQEYAVTVFDPPATVEIGGKPVINGKVTLP